MGLFGLRPKRTHYAKRAHLRHLFARKGDFICSYHGPTRTPTDCVTQPSMYLFSDPADPHHRYIDSWSADTGVSSYEGFINESFNDDQINCTIKWPPDRPTTGVYAKRDILLNEELLTEYGKPQWVYTIHFFSHQLSTQTIREATKRYNITKEDRLALHLAALMRQTSPPTPISPTPLNNPHQSPTHQPTNPITPHTTTLITSPAPHRTQQSPTRPLCTSTTPPQPS